MPISCLFWALKRSVVQWNLDLTSYQGTEEMRSLNRGFVNRGSVPYILLTVTFAGPKNIVRYTEVFVK